MQSNIDLQLSSFGFIDTLSDARYIVQVCLQGRLPFVQRRPRTPERDAIAQSGHIFVYEENGRDFQRWTDGRKWTQSRALGDFLIYGEQESTSRRPQTLHMVDQPGESEDGREDLERRLYGSLANSFNCHSHSLIKKTISINDFGRPCRLISYYRPVDVLQGQLKSPSVDQANEDIMHMLHLEGSLVPREDSTLSYQAGEHSVRSSIYPWDIWTSTLINSRPYHHASNELDHDHCNVQQNALPYSGVLHMEAIHWANDVQSDPSAGPQSGASMAGDVRF
jgi:hypothetical protein